jgi:hypothetical protein
MNIDATNVVIGAYGSGSRPVLNWTGANASTLIGMTSNARNVSIQDLAFNSSGSNVAMAVKPQGTNITVRNNEFISAYYGVNNNGKPTGVLIQDNQVTKANGIKSYFVWVAGTDIVILGNTSVATGESNIRMSQYERVNISENTLRDNDKATVIAQKGSYVYVSGNDIYDANMGAGPLGKGDGLAQDPDYKTVRTQWVVFEDNHLYNTGIGIVHGAEHVMIRNNVVERNGGVAFSVEGYDSAYERTASDVQIIGNTATNNSTQGNFLKTWAGNKYLVVKNNVYVAPNLQTGAYNTAAMYVLAGNLNGFSEISGNIWPTVNALAYANGGTHYLWASWSNSEGYKDGKEWEAYSQVQNDVYQNVTLKNTYTASVGGVTAGSSLDKAA